MEPNAPLKQLEEARTAGRIDDEEYRQRQAELSASAAGSAATAAPGARSSEQAPAGISEGLESEAAGEVPARSVESLQTGAVIGPDSHRFRLISLLHDGEMNQIWLAQDLAAAVQAGSPLLFKALKIFTPQAPEGAVEGKRWDMINWRAYLVKMRVRVELAVPLNHPSIAKIYGWRQGKDGWLFVESEYVDRRTSCSLDNLLRREGHPGLGFERTIRLLFPIAEALDYAHREHRLAHRNLRLETVFAIPGDGVKLVNFGLVGFEGREAREPAGIPETSDSAAETQAAQSRFKQDVGALAVLACQLLTGESRWPSPVWAGGGPPKPAELNEAAWQVLQQSVDYLSKGCPGSAVEMLQRLQKAQGLEPLSQTRRTKFPLAAALGLAALLGGLIWWYFQRPGMEPSGTAALVPSGQSGEQQPVTAQDQKAGLTEPGEEQQEEEARVRREMDDSAFAAAQRIGTVTAYRIYLQRCPDCGHQQAAETAIRELGLKTRINELKAQFEARLKARELAGGQRRDRSYALGVLEELEALNPQDAFIAEGKKRIALAYAELARESLNKGEFAETRSWLSKGEAVQPGLSALAALVVEIDRAERKFQDDAAYAHAEQINTQKAYQTYIENCAALCGHRREAEVAIEGLKAGPPSVANTVFRDRLADGSLGPEMVLVPAGAIVMGSPPSETGRFSDEHQHPIQIPKPFAIGRYEVTFAEYDRFAEATGRAKPDDKGWGRGRRPVINVDWRDAVAYAEWLAAQTGQRYRLPTEAEWEYAARAGNQTSRFWGDDPNEGCAYANGADLVGKRVFAGWNAMNCRDGYIYTAPVGSYKANAFDLYDMLGNVLEWTCSAYEEDYNGADQRCEARDSKALHLVYRGGSWSDEPRSLRVADRHKGTVDFREYFVGFRLARQL